MWDVNNDDEQDLGEPEHDDTVTGVRGCLYASLESNICSIRVRVSVVQIAHQASFDEMSTPLIDVTFCVLDLETTGGSAKNCEITEIGAVKYKGGVPLGEFQTLVDPGLEIPPSITLLTGITQAMVFDAPKIATALPTFLEFLHGTVIVGHNVRFDLSFLNEAAQRLGYPTLSNRWVDTAALARRLIRSEVRNLRLASLAAHFASPTKPNHRALEDAKATAHVLHCLLERAGTIGVTNLDDLIQLRSAKGGAHYSKIGLTEHLPRAPGVYLMKDRTGAVIYVGKASNLRARVRQYFYGDSRRSVATLMSELHSLDHRVCASPLEAEVTELRLIHTHIPRHNRRSKPPKSAHFVKLTKERFPRLSVVRSTHTDAHLYLGPFRSKRAADQVVMAIWDALPIRRCRSSPGSRTGRCASAQMGRSLCPCDGTLPPVQYAATVEALIEAVESDPSALLEPLNERMHSLAQQARYEDAASLRDRHDALANALLRRRHWRALQEAGVATLEDDNGRHTRIDHGKLLDVSKPDETLIDFPRSGHHEPTSIPNSVQESDEAEIIWRWLNSGQLRLVDISGVLALPRTKVERLSVKRQKAA